MLRLLGLMPSVEPTEQEKAEARILEQTGYTSETIEGFKQTIRDRELQIRHMEESLTTRILLLQKERDEALLGIRVGLSPDKPLLPPASADDLATVELHPNEAELNGGGGSGALASEERRQYEQRIDELMRQMQHLQTAMQYATQPYGGGGAGGVSSPIGTGEDGPSLSQLHFSPSPSPNPLTAGYTSPAQETSAAIVRSFSERLAKAEAEAVQLRQQLDQEREAKEGIERHLAGVLASPALAKVTSPMQYPDGVSDSATGTDGEHSGGQSHGHQRRSSSGSASTSASSSGDLLPIPTDATNELIRLRAELHQASRERDALQEQTHQQEQLLQQSNEQRQQWETYASQMETQSRTQIEQLHAQLEHNRLQATQQLSDLQTTLQYRENDIARLQQELLQANSIDHSSTSHSSSSSSANGDLQSLHQRIAQLQSDLLQQSRAAEEDKKSTQAILAEKLEKVRTIIQGKDETIKKLKHALEQFRSQQQPQQPQQSHPVPQ